MSKYARIIDIEKLLYRKGFCIGKTPDELYEALSDLPTIEVSEDAISRKWIMSRIESEYLKWLEDYDIDQILGDIEDAPSVIPKAKEGEWKWEMNDICHNCGYKIPHLERIVGETVLMDSKDWSFCPNCGSRR